jgi:hypothetical protein
MEDIHINRRVPSKNLRPVAEHIMIVLIEHKKKGGKGLRFRDIKIEMLKKGWLHSDAGIVHNYQYLVEKGLVKRDGLYYSIPDEEAKGDGT